MHWSPGVAKNPELGKTPLGFVRNILYTEREHLGEDGGFQQSPRRYRHGACTMVSLELRWDFQRSRREGIIYA